MVSRQKLKRISWFILALALVAFLLERYLGGDWSDFFSGFLVGISATWTVVAIIVLLSTARKK